MVSNNYSQNVINVFEQILPEAAKEPIVSFEIPVLVGSFRITYDEKSDRLTAMMSNMAALPSGLLEEDSLLVQGVRRISVKPLEAIKPGMQRNSFDFESNANKEDFAGRVLEVYRTKTFNLYARKNWTLQQELRAAQAEQVIVKARYDQNPFNAIVPALEAILKTQANWQQVAMMSEPPETIDGEIVTPELIEAKLLLANEYAAAAEKLIELATEKELMGYCSEEEIISNICSGVLIKLKATLDLSTADGKLLDRMNSGQILALNDRINAALAEHDTPREIDETVVPDDEIETKDDEDLGKEASGESLSEESSKSPGLLEEPSALEGTKSKTARK